MAPDCKQPTDSRESSSVYGSSGGGAKNIIQ